MIIRGTNTEYVFLFSHTNIPLKKYMIITMTERLKFINQWRSLHALLINFVVHKMTTDWVYEGLIIRKKRNRTKGCCSIKKEGITVNVGCCLTNRKQF